uniref:Si:ch211-195j11.27 n=1 Tax=Cyprinus carpio TaxID=7962 RepID=A0A8C2FRM2_CYPCA
MDGSLFVLLLLSGLFWSSSALSRQYHYMNARMSWPEAQSYCRERFTDLATVDSMDDVNRLVNIVEAGYNGSVWIGLKRGTQARWVWSNGDDTLSQYTNWPKDEPQSPYECALTGSSHWRSYMCSYTSFFSCYNESTGYIRVTLGKNWTEAQRYCRTYHTDLSIIRNNEDANRLREIIVYPEYLWFGLFLDSWEWSDKWNRFFRYWAAGQPSQSSGSGDCVGMLRNNSGKWAQYSCDLQQPFFCYGDEKFVRKPIVRLKLSCNGKCALNDHSLQTAILNKISEKLTSMGLQNDSKISWRKGEGEEVFHEEINSTATSNKCRGP